MSDEKLKPRWSLPLWAVFVLLGVISAGVLFLAAAVAPVPEHLHSHVSITVDGAPQVVPANVGINEKTQVTLPLHTHDTTGILHVESPTQRTFELGEFFAEWGVPLDSEGVGDFRQSSTESFSVFVNQRPFEGDPATIALTNKLDIDLVLAPRGTTPAPSAPFAWPAEY
ncbi:hypothetical protein KPL76_08260 [Subtercola sp. PAMC28395]|uniref:hypothetical protein n=1 Tax=Subtercola sp. PAMC28395 TaxID=2846775 RepID=UPI001C0D2ABC|nr:hypothetical protein [Subtercola sp. PAMC28395]QWT22796.1 hypothetical protein KPL76_08260 [Subtercola sp. PAMC28395]